MKKGIMGGTFDPIHLGHLVTAEEVRDYFHLDEVVFVPSARPPHKVGQAVSYTHLGRKFVSILPEMPSLDS